MHQPMKCMPIYAKDHKGVRQERIRKLEVPDIRELATCHVLAVARGRWQSRKAALEACGRLGSGCPGMDASR